MSFGTSFLLLQTIQVWRMMVDKPLASGSEALVDASLFAARRSAAMAAGFSAAALCGFRSRVGFGCCWAFGPRFVFFFLSDVG
ncbi:hypothetical protein RchiOBHm_Chr3g0481581 [Rosa chinensis]|uniref:Uncharacterized protein n=1 Tax=Rosa chinensis TaxID=74649 RepID=A0A2P6RDZ6_ROSCH|nr:hypothetical protein RchiOBHm_Chr3g0481581 [Rosa chinensis]